MGPFGANRELKEYYEHKSCIGGTRAQKIGSYDAVPKASLPLGYYRITERTKPFYRSKSYSWRGEGKEQVSKHTNDPPDLKQMQVLSKSGRGGGTFSFETNKKSQHAGEKDKASAAVLWKAAKVCMHFLHLIFNILEWALTAKKKSDFRSTNHSSSQTHGANFGCLI